MNYKDVLNKYKSLDEDLKWYFQELPSLINKGFQYEICIAYLFMQLETARLMTLYCGIKRKYKTDTEVTWKILDANEINWKNFKEFFFNIYHKKYDTNLHKRLEFAIRIRNILIHGGSAKEQDKIKCILNIFDFCINYNNYIYKIAGFKPIGRLTGVFGASIYNLDGEVSRMVMRGLNFSA